MIYVERFFNPIRELAQRYNTFQAAMAASERIFGLLDQQPDLDDAPDARDLPAIEGRVRFDHVDFAYKPEEPVLQDFDLVAEPGERIALVGETGAGKSTVIRLLSRFFDVTGGAITIDGYDLRDVTVTSLRSQLGIVLQDTFLFGGTILDNIRYGQLDATDDECIAAAKAVGAHSFIRHLPESYWTEVGEDGVNLSVGQRQILSCARAYLADPRILIMDEATSSVDNHQRAADPARDGRADGGPHQLRDRPPPQHHRQRRQDRRHGPGPHRRGRVAPVAAGSARSLPRAVYDAVVAGKFGRLA